MADLSKLSPIPPDDREKAALWFESLQKGAKEEIAQAIQNQEPVAKAMARLGTRLDDTTRALYARFDQLRKKKKTIPVVACKMGCWHCCTHRVTCHIPEAIRIAEHIKTKWTPEQRAEVQKRIDAHRVEADKQEGEAKLSRSQRCAFLTDAGACGIHSLRPIACRGYSSFDVRQCLLSRENPLDKTIQVPVVAHQFTASRSILKGIGEGLKETGLESRTVELIQAVDICLNNPEAAEQWLAGGAPFEDAIDRLPDPKAL